MNARTQIHTHTHTHTLLVGSVPAFSHQYVLLPWSLDSESHLESLVLAYNDDRNAVVQAEEPFVLLTLGITVFTLEVRHS